MTQPGATPQITVKVDGAQLDTAVEAVLVEAVVDEQLGAAAMCTLRFQDNDLDVLKRGNLKIGGELQVAMELGSDSPQTVFDGEITAVEMDFGEDHQSDAIVRALDRSHRLMRGRGTRVFKQVKYHEIAERLGRDAGLQVDVDRSSVQHEYVLQHNLSSWAFVTELAREIGYDARIDGKKLEFKKASSAGSAAVELTWGESLKRLNVRATGAEQVKEAEIVGWDPKEKKLVNGSSNTARSDTTTVEAFAPSRLEGSNRADPLRGTATPYHTAAEADAAAKAAAGDIASASVELHGTTHGTPKLRAGKSVKLLDIGDDFSGVYLLSAVRHIFDPLEGYRTEFSVHGRQGGTLSALVGGDADRRAPAGSLPTHGVVTALVVDNDDKEHGDGRVKVAFPWMGKDNSANTDVESAWARVAQLSSGSAHGSLWIPEVNEEVLVIFDHGDVRHPYVIGSLYNGKDKPEHQADAYVKSSAVAIRGFTTPKKNRLKFVDESGKEQVALSCGDGKYTLDLNKGDTKILIDSDGTIEIKGKKDITIESDANITMKAKQDLKLEAGSKLELSAKAGMKLDSSAKLEAKGMAVDIAADTKVDVKANAALALNGSASAELKSTGILQVQGSLVKIN